MHRIRLGITVFVFKWTASGVRVGSSNFCEIGNRRSRREARLLQTRCRNGRGCNLTRLLKYLVCGLLRLSGSCWMKQSIMYKSVSWVGSVAVVVVDNVRHDGMHRSVWFEQGREEAFEADWSGMW